MTGRVAWSILVAALLVAGGSAASGEAGHSEQQASDDDEEPADGAAEGPHGDATAENPEGGRSITDDLECDACHNQTSFKMISKANPSGGFDHSRTGFPLEGRHRDLGCTECHKATRSINRECVGCHQDQHQGRLGRDCDRCHSPVSWRILKTQEIHQRTRLPLTGRHATADCTQCHRRNGRLQWSGTPSDCFSCHESDYRRNDIHPVHTGTASRPPFPRDCAQCHRPTGWSPAIINPSALPGRDPLVSAASHDARFPLIGAHRGAPCDSCHISSSARRAVRCTGCHAHNPLRLRRIHGAKLVSFDGSSCLTCHRNGRAP